MYVYIYIYIYIDRYIHTYDGVVHMSELRPGDLIRLICIYVCIYIYVCMYVYICIDRCMHTYI